MITITQPAAARLALLIGEEPDADKLGISLVPTTTGCGSFAYSIAITEGKSGDQVLDVSGIRVFYPEREGEQIAGIVIDFDVASGRFSLTYPRLVQTDCRIPIE